MKSENGLSKLVTTVKENSEENQQVQKVTSNEMFKSSLMNFINKEMENIDDNNIDVLTNQQNLANQKLFELLNEDELEASDVFRLSDMLAKQKNMESIQKNHRINALFEILKPTKDSSNPLLNNEKGEEDNTSNIDFNSNEMQVMLKLVTSLASSNNSNNKPSDNEENE